MYRRRFLSSAFFFNIINRFVFLDHMYCCKYINTLKSYGKNSNYDKN